MNYRHAYHAGNFADVLKHAVLALVIGYMKQKPQPLRVIDVHAGIARYDLAGVEAGKTGEWRSGIARVLSGDLPEDVAGLLAPYLDAVRSLNDGGALTVYPGSPLLARMLMRTFDILVANELHEEDCASLRAALAGKPNTKVMALDAYVALKSLLPPPERRGVVLIDPPFEVPGEFERITEGLAGALKRFETGTYIIWYPVKDVQDVTRFLRVIRGLGISKALNMTLAVAGRGTIAGLSETGLLVVNPPFVLKDQLARLGPALSDILSQGPGAGFAIEDLAS